MDFQYFKTQVYKRDESYPPRQHDISMLHVVLDGNLYEPLPHPFNKEQQDGSQQYIPLRERRPSVRYNLCRIVVDDSVSLLFGDGHFPAIDCKDEATRDALGDLAKDTNLPAAMVEAAMAGAAGSVAIVMRVLEGRLFWSVMRTAFLTPVWRKDAPDTLKLVREQYKVKGRALIDAGYDGITADDAASDFWFRRDFDAQAETWYLPAKVEPNKEPQWQVDAANTTLHKLGFVPVVWVKNLPGGNGIDGSPTIPSEAIDTMIEVDYQLSQAGRGLKYSSDPTLLVKEPAVDNDGKLIKGGGNAIVVGPDGDAKMLEISGAASAAVIEYVRALRELAIENAHGNRSNADKLSAAQSGRAMELMNQSLIWLADKLRTSYGDALLELLGMACMARAKFELTNKLGEKVPELKREKLSLRWPHWYAPTYADKQMEVSTLAEATGGRQLLSHETAIASLASSYDVADPADELRKVKADGPMPNQPKPEGTKPNPIDSGDAD